MIEVNRDLHSLIKLMEATGENGVSLLLLIALGASRAKEFAQVENDFVTEFRAHRIANEVSIILRKEGVNIEKG